MSADLISADSMFVDPIAVHIRRIHQSIPPEVRLIAVTKQVSVSAMRSAYAAGIRDFGESRIQEAEAKQAQLQDLPDITWHLIGHLQSNKAQKALQHFHWIHSVDSLALAQRLDRLAAGQIQKPLICLQVKLLPDPSKFGWSVDELINDLPTLDQCQNLSIQGLMTIPPLGLSSAETLALFQETRNLADTIKQLRDWHNIRLNELSMGMSGDYSLAIQAGTTMVRLGQVLFGQR